MIATKNRVYYYFLNIKQISKWKLLLRTSEHRIAIRVVIVVFVCLCVWTSALINNNSERRNWAISNYFIFIIETLKMKFFFIFFFFIRIIMNTNHSNNRRPLSFVSLSARPSVRSCIALYKPNTRY